MKAKYTVKIGGVFYKAGEELPNDNKAVTVSKETVPPVLETKPDVEQTKRHNNRRNKGE